MEVAVTAPKCPRHANEVDLFDSDFQECPYPAYEVLRNEAPVWQDPKTGLFVVTSFEQVREVLLDPKTYLSGAPRPAAATSDREARMTALYEEHGWLPARTLGARDDPDHRALRAIFNEAFRPGKIKLLEPFVEQTARSLVDTFIDEGRCEWVSAMAVPLPLTVIGKQMGANAEDLGRIKAWTDAWVQRLGRMQTEDEERWSVEMEIEAQHYFQAIFERLRSEPDDTLLSELVNRVVPEWGRPMTDNELHAEMMADTFVGGAETTTNALSAGIMLLCQNPEVWQKLKNDPEKNLRPFIEEVLRLESPVQGLFRTAARDTELGGVPIPQGASINVRYAAANRDENEFECPEKMDLDREKPARHMTFGSGIHHCLGAPLARRELWWGFKAFFDRVEEVHLIDGANDFRHQPNIALRILNELHIGFTKERVSP
jgi:cytochrome P450